MSWFLNENQLLRYSTQKIWQNRYYEATYIEFDWEHNGGWIDTGIVDDGQDTWLVNFELLGIGAENWICGTVNHSRGVAWMVGTDSGSGWYGGQGQWHYTSGIVLNQRISCSKSAWGSYPFTNRIYLGCRNWGQEGTPRANNGTPSHFRVYQFDISRSGAALCTMRPAYDSVNDEWGMYDTTRNQFFGNVGGEGTSIAGGYIGSFDSTPLVLDYNYEDRNKSDWYMTDSDLITADMIPESLGWEQPYPVGVWYMNEYLELKAGGIPDRLRWEKPYPYSVWYYAYDMDHVFDSAIPELLEITYGAFTGCANLEKIKFARSLLSIGKYSCTETALTSVTIPANCTYYETTFPPGCEVHTFPTT